MNLACVFKFNAKPTTIKKPISISRKNKLLEQVCLIQEQLLLLEDEINLLKQQKKDVVVDTTLQNKDSIVTTKNTTSKQWQLTINQNSNGISFETSIKNMSDIASFLYDSIHYFKDTSLRTPNYYVNRSEQTLVITNKLLQVEAILHSFFKKKQKVEIPLIAYTPSHPERTQFKLQLIQNYFNCAGLINPIFSKPYFLPIFLANPHSMVSTAISAFVAYTHCRHVHYVPPSMTRELWAESFRQEAKELLQNVLLEQEPNILTAGTLLLLAQCALINLQNIEARLYANIAWRMILLLKDQYIPPLRDITPDTPVTDAIFIAESFRRMFYIVRYLELNLCMIYDGLVDFSSILRDYSLGSPIVLKNEYEDFNALDVFRYVCSLHVCQMPCDELKFQMLAGSLDSISITDIDKLENQLLNYWKSLPVEYRLSDSPLQYLQVDRIQQCSNPYVIYLNQLYYCYWLALETRIMQQPSSADLIGANMDRFDGIRALLIVSICCDAIAKIFQVLYSRLPCTVELHWLLIASDAMTMLKTAKNLHISERAKVSLKITLRVLSKRVQQVTNQQGWENMLPSCSSSTCSDTSANRHTTAYFDELENTLYTCFQP